MSGRGGDPFLSEPCRISSYTELTLDRAPETIEDRPPRPAAYAGREETLTRVCADDLMEAFGLCRRWTGAPGVCKSRLRVLATRILEPGCRLPAARLARQISFYDEIVGERGLAAGGAWAVERLARSLTVHGPEGVPEAGPVIVVSNHPGLGDSLALFAALPRSDLRVIAAERAFLRALPNTSRYLIPVGGDPAGRPAGLGGLREASRHLKRGGAILTFPRGGIEPDPACMPGAEASLEGWRRSLELFLRLAPETTVIPAIVSGVISPTALSSPATRLRRLPEDQRWLAASLQMLVPALRDVHTEVRFGHPMRATGTAPGQSKAVLEEARRMIRAAGPGEPGEV